MNTIRNLELNNQRGLKVFKDPNQNVLRIVNPLPNAKYSWFVTDDSGDLSLSGKVIGNHATINLDDLNEGKYYFRAQGEKIELQVGIAS